MSLAALLLVVQLLLRLLVIQVKLFVLKGRVCWCLLGSGSDNSDETNVPIPKTESFRLPSLLIFIKNAIKCVVNTKAGLVTLVVEQLNTY